MTQEFDPRKSYLAVKANEKMIAFVGFAIQLEADGQSKEGVVKISSLHRPYGGGYLTLTFMVDKGPGDAPENELEMICANITACLPSPRYLRRCTFWSCPIGRRACP